MLRRALLASVRRARVAYYRAISTGSFTGKSPRIISPVLLLGSGTVSAGGSTLGFWPSANLTEGHIHIQTSGPSVRVTIGSGSIINNGSILLAEGAGIEIGHDVLIGRNVEIYDSDRHELDPARRHTGTPTTGLVVIEDNVSSARASRSEKACESAATA